MKLYPLLIEFSFGRINLRGWFLRSMSTLFNTLVGESIAKAGAMAGLTKRCLLGVHSSLTQDNPVWAEIVEPFGGRPADPFDPNEPPEESISKKDIPTVPSSTIHRPTLS